MVTWTLKARRRLRSLMARRLCPPRVIGDLEAEAADPDPVVPERAALAALMNERLMELAQILEEVFGEEAHVVVQDVLLGYRRHEDRYILLVEVSGGDRPGGHVVKIGAYHELFPELAAWESCKPDGLVHDLVLLPLECGYEAEGDDPNRRMALLYGAAHQLIGVESITTFEEAALTSVLHGWPMLESIGVVLWELYERLGHLLYYVQFEYDPAKEYARDRRNRYVLEIGHLEENLRLWHTDPFRNIQRIVNAALQNRMGGGQFINPVDYLEKTVLQIVNWLKEDGKVHRNARDNGPRPEDLVPGMMRGCAHGDLHGRNILVGQVRGRVLWPTVFDYEDMGPCNWIGWDFVKMETELKIRAYPSLFLGPLSLPEKDGPEDESEIHPHYVESIANFEQELASETERCHQNNRWPRVAEADSAEARLKAVLLEIRHRAAIHLGDNFGRPKRWLEEYYFLLGCYGVSVARFGNLIDKQTAAAMISAGVAFARLNWPRTYSGGR